MKATKRINVEVLRKKFLPTIDAVQFDTALQIILVVRDFTIPDGTTARAFFKKPSGKFVYQDCTISGNEITIDVDNQALTEYGDVYYQVRLTNGSDIITTFKGKIEVEKSLADDSATPSKTVVPAFDAAVQDAVAEIEEARDNAITYIGNGIDNTLSVEGKAADAKAAGEAVAELKGDLDSKFSGGELDINGNICTEENNALESYVDNGKVQKNQYTSKYACTDYIKVESGVKYAFLTTSGHIYAIALYDKDKVYIEPQISFPKVVDIPTNCEYVIVCIRGDSVNEKIGSGIITVIKSETAISEYIPPTYLPIHVVGSDYVTEEVTNVLDERVTVLEGTTNKQYINLASDYYITNGDTLELFYRGLLNLGDYKKYNIKIECSVGGYFGKRYIFTPTASNVGNDYPLTLSLYDDNDKLIESATTIIHCIEKKTNPSDQVNVLCIGDSLTTNGKWVTELQSLLNNDGLTNVNFIGTCGVSPAKYEGYGGWSIASYNSSMATNAYMWVNVSSHDKTSSDQHSVYVDSNGAKWKIETIETNKLKMIRTSGSSAIPTSGSLTWESGGDNHSDIVYSSVEQSRGNPFWNESTSKNDFVTYANHQGVSTIDYCFILIGWNQSSWNEAYTKTETEKFINSLRTDFPNCKIILAGLQIPSLDGCGNNYGCDWYWKDKVNFVFNLQKWYEDIANNDENITFTQVSGQFDSENNMPMYQRTVNKRNSNKEYFGGNGVHPADSGYLQIADVFYRAFHSF